MSYIAIGSSLAECRVEYWHSQIQVATLVAIL